MTFADVQDFARVRGEDAVHAAQATATQAIERAMVLAIVADHGHRSNAPRRFHAPYFPPSGKLTTAKDCGALP